MKKYKTIYLGIHHFLTWHISQHFTLYIYLKIASLLYIVGPYPHSLSFQESW